MSEQLRIETGVGSLAVLWHSLFVDDRSWRRVEPELAADRRLLLITGPGHGTSTDPGRRYTLEECAEAALTVLDTLGVRRPVDWLGNAWGGHVGVCFAERWPDRCRSLVTVGTPVPALTARERARTWLLLAAYRTLGPVRFIRAGVSGVLLSPATRTTDPDAVALVEESLSTAGRAGLVNAIVSISLHRRDLTEDLGRVRPPTLFITGSDHEGWTPERCRAAATRLPRGSCAEVPDAAYLAPLEQPGAIASLVREFWASQLHGVEGAEDQRPR